MENQEILQDVNIQDTKKTDKKVISKMLIIISVYLVITLLLQFVSGAIFGKYIIGNQFLTLLATFLPQYLIAFPVLCLLFKKLLPCNSLQNGEKVSIGEFVGRYSTTLSAMYITNVLTLVILSTIMGATGIVSGNPLLSVVQKSDILSFVATLVFVCVCAPIAEELIFRKFIIDRTIKHGEGLAIFISTISFGLFHGNIYQIPYAMVLGYFFAKIYIKTKDVRYAIVLHMLVNIIGAVTSQFMDNEIVLAIVGVFVFVNIIGGIIYFCIKRKKFKTNVLETDLPKSKRFSYTFLHIGGIIFLLLIVLVTVLNFTAMIGQGMPTA